MNMFRPRSWKVRFDAAESRTKREENLFDLHAVRAALFHGAEVPADAVARINERERAAKIERGEVVDDAPESEDSDTDISGNDEPKRRGGRPRKTDG